MASQIKLNNGRTIGADHEPYIIAELCVNHNGDMDMARRMIQTAANVGCHCVKFQTWSKSSLFSRVVYDGNTELEQALDQYSLTFDQLRTLKLYANQQGLDFSASAFCEDEVDFLVDECHVPFIKIASMDINNYPFIRYIASRQVPILLALGLSALSEIDIAINEIEKVGNRQIVLLHCVSNYPPEPEEINLRNLTTLQLLYPDYPVGFSDHSIGIHIPIAATALGACVLEKHFTIDKSLSGWDHAVSANPDEMKAICRETKDVFCSLGTTRKVVGVREIEKRKVFRRSVVAQRAIPEGKIIDAADLTCKRPGTGLPPEAMEIIIGRPAKRNISHDALLMLGDF